MSDGKLHRVSEVAAASGVTVRTLHHYDEIRLLSPAARSPAGYRLYSDEDLLRLQQILIHRALGFSLEQTRAFLDDPEFDQRAALQKQRKDLLDRITETRKAVRTIEETIERLDQQSPGGNPMKELFEGFRPEDHEREAKARWGNTPQFAEAARRTKRYTEADWRELKDEQDEIYRAMSALMRARVAPTDPEAIEVAQRHRASIERWFYPCGPALHEALANMYESDIRFARNIDRFGKGLAPYLARAIRESAARDS